MGHTYMYIVMHRDYSDDYHYQDKVHGVFLSEEDAVTTLEKEFKEWNTISDHREDYWVVKTEVGCLYPFSAVVKEYK